MIVEQSFFVLPEVLCGSRYPGQEYESGVVIALTMSILQELNGRNARNPLSFVQGECLYDENGFGIGRWLRADLVLDSRALYVANSRLGKHYGWRHRNWLEAKFMRKRTGVSSTNKTQSTALLLADLIRLAVLVPETPGSDTENARYLLHIYDRPPSEYISSRRNKNSNGAGGTRRWAKAINLGGPQTLKIDALDKEPDSFVKLLGQMGDLALSLDVTTQVIEPRCEDEADDQKLYWCYLTRIDSARVEWNGRGFRLNENRAVEEDADGDLTAIRAHVVANLGQVSADEQTQPADLAPAENQDDQDTSTDDELPAPD